jgi:hypothetical protein
LGCKWRSQSYGAGAALSDDRKPGIGKNLGQSIVQIADADVTLLVEGELYHIIKPEQRLISESRILDYKDLWQIYRHCTA